MEKKLNSFKVNSPWVLLDIDNVVYAISCEMVLSLNQLPQITPLPIAPVGIRGVIDFRGRSIQLVDTRMILNIGTIPDEVNEFNNIMNQRYNDHINWINTLEKSVKEEIEFTLTTDPHKCAFGKWYDSYHTENTNIMFSSTFAKFDKPHKAIHQIGIKVEKLITEGNRDAAIALINSVKDTELKQMLHLFDELKGAYKESRKEIVVVIGRDEQHCIGLSVDKIEAIEHLFEIDESTVKESITNTEYLTGVGKRKDGSVVFLLNDEYIFSEFH